MSDAGTISAEQSLPDAGGGDDDELARDVTTVVAEMLGRAVAVASVRRRPCEFAALVPCEEVTALLSDGRRLSLFVKLTDGGPTDHPDKSRRDRERLVYERLLSPHASRLPVPRYYGTRGRRMFLEFVGDWSLKYHDLTHWFAAAARLAQLHAHFATRGDVLGASTFLLTLDKGYLQQWYGRALAAVAARPDAVLAARVEALRSGLADAAALLAAQPPTLVHNDLAPKNVLADRSTTPARICIVDWEVAGVGCGLLDLVHLKYGLDAESDRRMVSAYRAELSEVGLLPRDDCEFARLLAACEMHKTLYRLAHSPRWKLPPERLAQWVAEAEVFLQRVQHP